MPYADPEMARAAARRRYLANRDVVIARSAAWAAAHPEKAKASKARTRAKPESQACRAAYYRDHREKIIAQSATWATEHPDQVAESKRKWAAEHPDARALAVRTYDQRPDVRVKRNEREAARRAQATTIVSRQAIWERDEGVCGLCGDAADRDDWHLDHIIPLAAGGQHTPENTQVSHPRCNMSKGARAWTT